MQFDYVIVGGGSAGCLLANRLSENPVNTVCLLEAGPPDNSHFIHNCNPVNMLFLMNSPKYNWRYYAEGNAKTGTRKFYWPRGKTLGGSSAVNAMIYTRGHTSDYDHWASLGNKGWDWKSVLPYFKKSELQHREIDAFHSREGTMDVIDPTFHFPPSHAFVKACVEAGIPYNHDINGEKYEGVDFFQINQTPEGRRCHSSVSFLDPVRSRKNLTVINYAHIKRVLFKDKTAYALEYFDMKDGKQLKTIEANKEIILSAGIIGSPQILKLSGVGPKAELEKHDIPIVLDLPGVGENLQDHPDIIIRYRDKSSSSLVTVPKPYMVKFMSKFYRKNKEPFIFTPTDAGGYVKSDPSVEVPDLQLQFASLRMLPHGAGLFTPSKPGFVLHVCHMRPNSRGRVLLNSANPFDNPRIEANYFDDEMELNALVNGVKIARKIIAQKAFDAYRGEEEVPGKSVCTDEQIRQFILDKAESVYHTAGSCKMGIDAMAVVDPELKIHGLKNIRVIDSSIMPTITGSNIHAPTVMIAEKGADMILNGI
ncbi:MAG TPA: GMC family oxidoreductase N-terminal domain-containing protein [Chitinophagales bacterium]|nr:GMC family oxidoreductase N-terminal domain-containing protein [Chitinophagales bacterium]HMU98413.1 GMC family oxidoreductase N-terminal domain-containing protein [Chitinophagales bacterium]HMW95335.1 GMC family oxidoreductase N-terminal domain-containing protein [Chitinophagales bacterium]HNK90223.1 GMC family oxidoreductase N-terminal domain-containing protein [Chitinophagales bacterium]HNM67306.1 GMC family oxidoreductase N-terminal domain-containing protein [Chitinophagales bacterium]